MKNTPTSSAPTTPAITQDGMAGADILHHLGHALPARRDVVVVAHPELAQRLVDVAAHALQFRIAARRAAILALEAERQAGMHEFEQVVARRRDWRGFPSAPGRSRRPEVRTLKNCASIEYCIQTPRSVPGRFCTMSSAVPQSAYLATLRVLLVHARFQHLLLEVADRLGDVVHQRHGLHVDDQEAQTPEQDEQRRRGRRDRVGGGILAAVTRIERNFQRYPLDAEGGACGCCVRRREERVLACGAAHPVVGPASRRRSRPAQAARVAAHRARHRAKAAAAARRMERAVRAAADRPAAAGRRAVRRWWCGTDPGADARPGWDG